MKNKFLPIGTVVLLKNGSKKIMITGYLPSAKDKPGNVYDYSACLFPEGVISSEQTVVFNHDQINDIISEGYSNEETSNFLVALDELLASNKKKAEQNNQQPVDDKVAEEIEMPKSADPVEDINVPNIEDETIKEGPQEPQQYDVNSIKPFSE